MFNLFIYVLYWENVYNNNSVKKLFHLKKHFHQIHISWLFQVFDQIFNSSARTHIHTYNTHTQWKFLYISISIYLSIYLYIYIYNLHTYGQLSTIHICTYTYIHIHLTYPRSIVSLRHQTSFAQDYIYIYIYIYIYWENKHIRIKKFITMVR